MKKINANTKFIMLITLIALMVISLAVIVIASVLNKDGGDGAHTHTFGEWSTNEPTCTENAKQTRACSSCTVVEERIKPALGHNIVNHSAKNPTCDEDGYNAYKSCTRCNYSTKEVKSALGHVAVSHEGKAASCTEDGYNAYETCERCSWSTKQVIPAGHTFENHRCTVCGASECAEHDFGEWFGNTATCQAGGVEYRECSACGQRETRDTEKAQHIYENKRCIWCEKYDYTLPSQPLGKKKDD